MNYYSLVLLLSLVVLNNAQGIAECRSDPETDDDDKVVGDGESFVLTCDLTHDSQHIDHLKLCRWEHFFPLNEHQGQSDIPDIECTCAPSGGSDCDCLSDSRINGTINDTSCSITVTNSNPNDTGIWTAYVTTAINPGVSQVVDIPMYTYNQTTLKILDDMNNGESVDTVMTTYNWDDEEEDWRENCETGFERIELTCYEEGGRPMPSFRWQINGDDLPDDEIFNNQAVNYPKGDLARVYGANGEITDREATISFDVSTEFLKVLADEYNVDTATDEFYFDLDCFVELGKNDTTKETVTIGVKKSCDMIQ